MWKAILLYNTQAGRGKIERNVDRIVEIFREADCDIQPQVIEFG
jgi:diacylglycerol kinase family enzyme